MRTRVRKIKLWSAVTLLGMTPIITGFSCNPYDGLIIYRKAAAAAPTCDSVDCVESMDLGR